MVLLEMKMNCKLMPMTDGRRKIWVSGFVDPCFFHERILSALSKIKKAQRQLLDVFLLAAPPWMSAEVARPNNATAQLFCVFLLALLWIDPFRPVDVSALGWLAVASDERSLVWRTFFWRSFLCAFALSDLAFFVLFSRDFACLFFLFLSMRSSTSSSSSSSASLSISAAKSSPPKVARVMPTPCFPFFPAFVIPFASTLPSTPKLLLSTQQS
mmetsp:Transcript_38255/g.80496  ORF Transcript_38255/g.80496 Transcript_38255/m.80496 type:complete len:213 (-) Transcript_38255:1068-1706(-)